MVTGWPFGTLRNVCRKVKAIRLKCASYHVGNRIVSIINALSSYSFTGPVFGNMDNFTGLGVFVDTYPNEEKYIEVRYSSTAGLQLLHESKVGLSDTR